MTTSRRRAPGAGRKPDLDTARTIRLELRLHEAEDAELRVAAGESPLGTWIREQALAAARR